MWHGLAHWFLHFTGSDNVSGPEYGFWSGFGSDLSELALIGALLGILRKHNCEVHGCWRLGRHKVEGTQLMVCRHHNPAGKLTADDVRKRHHLYLGSRPGKG